MGERKIEEMANDYEKLLATRATAGKARKKEVITAVPLTAHCDAPQAWS